MPVEDEPKIKKCNLLESFLFSETWDAFFVIIECGGQIKNTEALKKIQDLLNKENFVEMLKNFISLRMSDLLKYTNENITKEDAFDVINCYTMFFKQLKNSFEEGDFLWENFGQNNQNNSVLLCIETFLNKLNETKILLEKIEKRPGIKDIATALNIVFDK